MSCEDIPSLLDLQNTKKHVDDLGRLMGTGEGDSTNGVTGQVRPTYNKVMGSLGYVRIGTFATGATLTTGRQTLLWDIADGGDGQEYGWSGSFLPSGKIVPPGSTPLTTGGIAVGAWMSRFDPELRIQVRESLRRSYAEAGYNLVGCSFEAGGTLVNANDVLLQERTGKAFSGPAGSVVAGTNPASGGFVDKSFAPAGYVAGAAAPLNSIFSKLQESISFLDYIPKSEHANILKGISSYDCTSAIQAAFNECFATGRALVQNGGIFKTTGRVSPTDSQTGSSNFDMPYPMFFGNVVIDYHGVGGTAFEIKNNTTQKSIADGVLLGSLEVINSGSGEYGIVLDGLNFWQVGKIKGGAAGKAFSERGVLIKSNNGKGGLWSSYAQVVGYGGKVPVDIGQTANANQFGRVWGGYGTEACIINSGARNTFNLMSIEFVAANNPQYGALINAPCLINGIEVESDGSPAGFKGGIFINTLDPVLCNQGTFVGVSPRYGWIPGAKFALWPSRTATELATKLEIITSSPLEIASSITPKKPLRNTVTVDSSNGGTPGNYGPYLSLLNTSFSGTLDLSGVLIVNNTGTDIDMQVRFTDFDLVDSTSRVIRIAAGATSRLGPSEFIECLDPDKNYYLIKARFRPVAAITGTASITSAAYRM